MALLNTINDITKDHISRFISSIAATYELGEEDLLAQWEKQMKLESKKNKSAGGKKGGVKKTTPLTTDPVPPEMLTGSTLVELKEFCRNRDLKVSGTKAILIARLKGEDENKPKDKAPPAKKPKKVVSDKRAAKIEGKSTVLEKLKGRAPTIEIRRDRKTGNLVHPETNLVFEGANGDHFAVGHQGDDGAVEPLTKEDIQNCKKFKFTFAAIPPNLDSKQEEGEDEEFEEEEEIIDDESEVEEDEAELEGSEPEGSDADSE